MGFEVLYSYYERLESGKYNTEEKKELKRKIGSPYEDTQLEQLATTIMAQLARRDIWVVDVEIYEFTKKKIGFRESPDGGLVIKNKKFCLDKADTPLVSCDLEEIPPATGLVNLAPQQKPLPRNEMTNRASNHGKVKTWLIFDPELPLVVEAQRKGLRFTVNKKYPIYQIVEHPMGLTYGNILTTVDDSGKQVTVADKFFVPAEINLIGDNEVSGGFSKTQGRPQGEPVLSFQGEVKDEVPVLRTNCNF